MRLERVPLRRMGTVAEVVSAVLYLASDDASYVSGAEAPRRRGARSPSKARRGQPHDLVEAPEADEERGVGHQLDDLGFRELAPHLRPQGVVHLLVVHRELLPQKRNGGTARAGSGGRRTRR